PVGPGRGRPECDALRISGRARGWQGPGRAAGRPAHGRDIEFATWAGSGKIAHGRHHAKAPRVALRCTRGFILATPNGVRNPRERVSGVKPRVQRSATRGAGA